MAMYRLKFHVYNSIRRDFPEQTVTLDVWGALGPIDASKRVHSIYVSADGQTVNTTGGVGRDGRWYAEWYFLGGRKLPERTAVA